MQASDKGCTMASAAAAALSLANNCIFKQPPASTTMQATNSPVDLSNDIPADDQKQLQQQKQDLHHKLGGALKSSSDRNDSPSRVGSKPGTPRSQQQPQQPQQRVLDLRHAGPESQHWTPGTATNACTQSPVHHVPQRPAWESSVAAVWGKPKPTELKPAGSAGAGGVLDLTGPDHTDSSHWCSVPRHAGSNAARGDVAAAATAGDLDNSHWAPSVPRRQSSDGSPHLQHEASTAADAAAVAAVYPGTHAAGVKRQLPLGSRADATGAGAAAANGWWAMDTPATAAAATGAQTAAAANQSVATVSRAVPQMEPAVHLAEVPASTFKRLKISSAEEYTMTRTDSGDMDCGLQQQQQQVQCTADAVDAANATEHQDAAQQEEEEDRWMKHQREVQRLKQQQVDLQQLLQQAEQHVKAPILREAQLLTMEMQDKVRARGLDSVSLAAISRDVPHIKRTADSDAERVAAHMLAQEGGNWKASLARMMRMVKTSVHQKQLLGLKKGELQNSSSPSSPAHSSGRPDTAAAAAGAIPEEQLHFQQQKQQCSAVNPQQHDTPVTLHWQHSVREGSPYTAAAGASAQVQVSPYAAAAATHSAHNSPAIRQYNTSGHMGQSATASPYTAGGYTAAAGAMLQRSGSPYTAGPVGLAGVLQPAAVSAAKLQWPMVPTSAVGSPVGSPACSPMVPSSAVGSPLTASTDAHGTVTCSGAAAGAAGGFSNLILPAPAWGGASVAAAAAAGVDTSAAAASAPVRYGSPLPSMHLGDASANCSPVNPAATAAGARGRSHSPAANCGRPKLVRQQSRMAPKQPQNKASVAAMTADGYHIDKHGGGGAAGAGAMSNMLGVETYPSLAPAGAAGYMPGSVAAGAPNAHMQAAGCNNTFATTVGMMDVAATEADDAAAAATAAAMPGSFDSSAHAADTVTVDSGAYHTAAAVAAAAAMPALASTHAYRAAAAGPAVDGVPATSGMAACCSDALATTPQGSLNHAAVATATAANAVLAQHEGVAAWDASSAAVMSGIVQSADVSAAAAAVAGAGGATAAGVPQAMLPSGADQQQQHLTTAAAAAAAFGCVTALTVDTDIEDAGWLFGEGGLLPDTPGPANLLAAQQQHKSQQQQQQGTVPVSHHQHNHQQHQHNTTTLAEMAPAAASSAAATAQHANAELVRAAGAFSVPPTAAAAASMGPEVGVSGSAIKPLGTDKDDIALLQMLLGWGNDS